MKLAFLVTFATHVLQFSSCCQRFNMNCCQKNKEKNKILQTLEIDEELKELMRGSHAEEVKLIIAQKYDLNRADELGQTPVFRAAWEGDIEIVRFLAEQKVDLNKSDVNGDTPVYVAAYKGHTKIVEFLATQEVDLNKKNGHPPVFVAAKKGHAEIVKILIESDVNLEENLLKIAATEDIKQMIDEAIFQTLQPMSPEKGWKFLKDGMEETFETPPTDRYGKSNQLDITPIKLHKK